MSATAEPPPAAKPAARAPRPAEGGLRRVGDFFGFSLRAYLETPGSLRYFSEILRQAGILAAGSTLVLVAVATIGGAECGLFGDYFLRSLGAQAYVGVFTSACGPREVIPLFFGYIMAAKVGCGLVAEIGSMRISDEIDAMESVGVSSMRFIVATRVVAATAVIPLIYVVALLAGHIGSFLVVSVQIGDVSRAAWESSHWGTQSLGTNLISIVKVIVFTNTVVLVGCFFGYRARGGAVGVGAATAQSMVANLALVNALNGIGSALLFSGQHYNFGG